MRKPGGLMSALASMATRPDLDTMVAHISPEDAAFLLRRGGSGKGNPRTGMPQFYSDGGSDSDSESEGGGRRGGDSGFSDTDQGTETDVDTRGVSNVDATRAAQSTGFGGYQDAQARGYGLTADALSDARGWGLSVGDTISKAGGGYGYGKDPAGMSGFASTASANFANSVFGADPQQQTDLAATSPGLMSALSSAQQFGTPQASVPAVQRAAIPQQGLPRGNFPRATNNPFGIMAGDKLRTFASLDDARKYQRDLLSSPRYSGKRMDEGIKTYVGNVDPAKQEAYVQNMEKWTGYPRDTVIDPKNTALMDAIQKGIMRQESGANWSDFFGGN